MVRLALLLAPIVFSIILYFLLKLGQFQCFFQLINIVFGQIIFHVAPDQNLIVLVLIEENVVVIEQVYGVDKFAIEVEQIDQQFVDLIGGKFEEAVLGMVDIVLEEEAPQKDNEYFHYD